ncbi:MAG: TlpA family protein disulfide reductase [Bryobacterales bacterium]|nr:TlpA family protein disulfide reductase [Bryobacterales bacterium]
MESNQEVNHDAWVGEQLATLNADDGWSPDAGAMLPALRRRQQYLLARRRTVRLAIGAAAAAGLGTMAIPQTRVFAQRCVGACTDTGTRVWNRITQPSPPDAAPDFALGDGGGALVRLSDLRGKVVLLNFWATWCPPCRVEIPWFVEFQSAYASSGFTVIGVSLDEDGWTSVNPFLASNSVNYPVVLGDHVLTGRYGGVRALPATFLINREGRITRMHSGLVSKHDYRNEIEALLAQ